jgi:hypothetical protein
MKASMIALRASTLIASSRAEQHGDMRRTFCAIASLWNTYLAHRRDKEATLSPSDVAKMMALLKLARSENGEFNADDFVDMAGYAAIAGELEGRGV